MDIWGIWIEYLWNMRCDRFLDLMDRCGIVHDHYVTYEHLFVIVSGDKYYIYIHIWVMGYGYVYACRASYPGLY